MNILKTVFVIIGAFIGAGFASGQEIYLFFYKYGKYGILGMALCSLLMGKIIYNTLCDQERIIQNKYKNKYLNFENIKEIIINIFLLISFYIMIAGFGAYFEQEFSINRYIGATILAIGCFLVFLKDIQGVVRVSSIIVPVLIGFIALIGISKIGSLPNMIMQESENKEATIAITIITAIIQGIIYCSYNLILIMPIITNLRTYTKTKKEKIQVSVISAIIIFILAICIMSLLSSISQADFKNIEMPAVYAISKNLPVLKPIYGMIILFSIFTTAISIGTSLLQKVSKNKKSYTQLASILCITSIIISNFGFSNLVKIMFPVFGIFGICFWGRRKKTGLSCFFLRPQKHYLITTL